MNSIYGKKSMCENSYFHAWNFGFHMWKKINLWNKNFRMEILGEGLHCRYCYSQKLNGADRLARLTLNWLCFIWTSPIGKWFKSVSFLQHFCWLYQISPSLTAFLPFLWSLARTMTWWKRQYEKKEHC